jgi:peptidoglycan hydrolase-like protein with peptidoglycan-binding domain
VEQWFQNTRGVVIIVLAVITGVVLLAIEPGDGSSSGSTSAAGGTGATVTTTVTTVPSPTTTTVAHATIQEGTTNTADTTILQQRLNALGYPVGTPDGDFGPTTTGAVKQFQTDHKLPVTGIVDAATWSALLATPSSSGSSSTTTTVKP